MPQLQSVLSVSCGCSLKRVWVLTSSPMRRLWPRVRIAIALLKTLVTAKLRALRYGTPAGVALPRHSAAQAAGGGELSRPSKGQLGRGPETTIKFFCNMNPFWGGCPSSASLPALPPCITYSNLESSGLLVTLPGGMAR